jgi:hypothetical protein
MPSLRCFFLAGLSRSWHMAATARYESSYKLDRRFYFYLTGRMGRRVICVLDD